MDCMVFMRMIDLVQELNMDIMDQQDVDKNELLYFTKGT